MGKPIQVPGTLDLAATEASAHVTGSMANSHKARHFVATVVGSHSTRTQVAGIIMASAVQELQLGPSAGVLLQAATGDIAAAGLLEVPHPLDHFLPPPSKCSALLSQLLSRANVASDHGDAEEKNGEHCLVSGALSCAR